MLLIRDLVKIYPGSVAALQGVDLDVADGMFGLLGPNGAGKTTLMRIVAGLLEPTAGSVTLDGADVVAEPASVWRRLGYLPQDFGFYPHLTGAAMLDFLLRLKGVRAPGGRKRLVAELLERVHLTEAAGRKVGVDGPEYETAASAACCGVFDPDYTMEYNWYCDEYGLDTISTGITMAFCCEAFDRGYLTAEDTGGLELAWGNADDLTRLLHQIAEGEGFGRQAGRGIRRLKGWIAERHAARSIRWR